MSNIPINIPWPWKTPRKNDEAPYTPPTPTPIISLGPNGLPRMPDPTPNPTPRPNPVTVIEGQRTVAEAYLERLKNRNEEKITETRLTPAAPTTTGKAPVRNSPSAAPVDPGISLPGITDLNPVYADLLSRLSGYGNNINTDFSASEKFIRDQYARSNVGLTGEYDKAKSAMDASIQGLGFGNIDNYQKNMNNITENADLSETADLTYLEKMKNARGIEMKDIMMATERDKVNQQAAQALAQQEAMIAALNARSGGGSGGRGGSGSSSGSKTLTGSETSTQTDTIDNPQLQAQYEYIKATEGEEAAAQYHEWVDATMGNSLVKGLTGAIGKLGTQYKTMKGYDNLNYYPSDTKSTAFNWFMKLPNQIIKQGKNTSASQKAALARLQSLRTSAYTGSGMWGNPSTTVKNTSTGKITNPKTKIDG